MSPDAQKPQPEFLYRIQPTRPEMLTAGPTVEEGAIIDRHFRYLQDLTEQKIVSLAGRTLNTDATTFGIVIFHAESEETARRIMESDPAVKNGVFRAALFPFRTALKSGD